MARIIAERRAKVHTKRKRTFRLVLLLFCSPGSSVFGLYLVDTSLRLFNGAAHRLRPEDFKTGWLCKTCQGELAMTTVPGTAPQIFIFR
jgi:hypothetical protein